MNFKPQGQQSINDDQELAKVLAGVTKNGNDSLADLQFEDAAPTPPPTDQPAEPTDTPAPADTPAEAAPADDAPAATPTEPVYQPAPSNLDSIKQEALHELRPLVDHLDVSPEEKFDTYLLLLRSTDDRDLIAPAYDAARGITDEARRAQALLDVIKEIDYLSQPQQSAA